MLWRLTENFMSPCAHHICHISRALVTAWSLLESGGICPYRLRDILQLGSDNCPRAMASMHPAVIGEVFDRAFREAMSSVPEPDAGKPYISLLG